MDAMKPLVRAVVQSKKEGVVARYFQREFCDITGGPVPYAKLGFASLQAFIFAIPDVVRISRGRDGEETYFAVADKSTMHIQSLIMGQKTAKKRATNKPYKTAMRRPNLHTASWSTQYRAAFPSRFGQPRAPSWPSGGGGGGSRPPAARYAPTQSAPSAFHRPFERPTGFAAPAARHAAPAAVRHAASTWVPVAAPKPPLLTTPVPPSPIPPSPTPRTPTTPTTQNGGPPSRRNSPFIGKTRGFQNAVKQVVRSSLAQTMKCDKTVTAIANGDLTVKVATPPRVPAEVTKYGVTYAVAPRFQRLTAQRHLEEGGEAIVEIGDGDAASHVRRDAETCRKTTETTATTPPLTTETTATTTTTMTTQRQASQPGGATVADYRTVLEAFARRCTGGGGAAASLDVSTTRLGQLRTSGYVSSVTIGRTVYGGGRGTFMTAEEAEEAALTNAIDDLGLVADLGKSLSELLDQQCRLTDRCEETSSPYLDKVRVNLQKLIGQRTNGLWSSGLVVAYTKECGETPPDNILQLAERWTDIVVVESVPGVEHKIIYPVQTSSIKMLQKSPTATCSIKPAVLPEVGTTLAVFMGHLADCSHFYVQTADSPINEIMQKLSEIYEARASPKELVGAQSGWYCVAQYADGNWYRAMVVSVTRGDDDDNDAQEVTFDVSYVDFGNVDLVPNRRVRRILDPSCVIPAQAIRCRLHAVHPLEESWSDEAIAAFTDLAMERKLDMTVVDVDGDGCVVSLTDPDDRSAGSIGEQLVGRGLARAAQLPSEPDGLEIPEDTEWHVFVTFINSTVDVVIRLVGPKYSEKLEETELSLASLGGRSLGGCDPVAGRMYAAVTPADAAAGADETWNRVRVVTAAAVGGGECEVLLVDHGDTELVGVQNLRPLPAYLNQLPYQAVKCKLTGLEPFEDDVAVEKKLLEMALGKTCIAEVNDRLGRISLTLWDTSTDDDVNINEVVAKELRTEDLTPKLPEKGGTIKGHLCHVAGDGAIYFQCQGPGLQRLQQLADQLAELYGRAGDASAFVSSPKTGQLCIAKCSEDGLWYRAKISRLLPNRMVDVYFVDYGNTDVVPYSSLREIGSDSRLMSLPWQAIRCALYDMPPAGGTWTDASLDELVALAPPGGLCVLEVVVPAAASGGATAQVEIHSGGGNSGGGNSGGGGAATVNEQLAALDYSYWVDSSVGHVDARSS